MVNGAKARDYSCVRWIVAAVRRRLGRLLGEAFDPGKFLDIARDLDRARGVEHDQFAIDLSACMRMRP
jgi:hypothetical protein